MGRPKGSVNKPKQIKAASTQEAVEQQKKVVEEVATAPAKKERFQVGKQIGQVWGIYAISRFGGNPVLVYESTDEVDVNERCKQLNATVSNILGL